MPSAKFRDRFDQHAFYDADQRPRQDEHSLGGFLGQVDQFDPDFFGISPREALRMDPQQRLLLEVTWEALQDAGQAPERLVGAQVGVFIGIATNDYGRLQWDDLERIDAYAGTVMHEHRRQPNLVPVRFPRAESRHRHGLFLVTRRRPPGLLQPAERRVHAGSGRGVNLILSPAIAINFTKAGAMAPDGRCKAFDARANGYVRSEGAGVVVLKTISKALAMVIRFMRSFAAAP